MTDALHLSVCVCTFKRPEGLARTLASLEAMDIPEGLSMEIVVVDNDPAASAAAVVDMARGMQRCELRSFVEARAGVGNARNRCMREARGEWIAFVDDDEIVTRPWLPALWSQAALSKADAVFGPVLALLPEPLPAWHRGSGFFDRHQMNSGAAMDWRHCASGNVLVRRDWLLRVDGFDAQFAKSGAEDTDLFRRCHDAGARMVWCAEAVIEETVSPHRMGRRWAWWRSFLGGQNYGRLILRHDGVGALAAVAIKGWLGVVLYALPALLWIPAHPGRALHYQCRFAASLGKAVGWLARSEQYASESAGSA